MKEIGQKIFRYVLSSGGNQVFGLRLVCKHWAGIISVHNLIHIDNFLSFRSTVFKPLYQLRLIPALCNGEFPFESLGGFERLLASVAIFDGVDERNYEQLLGTIMKVEAEVASEDLEVLAMALRTGIRWEGGYLIILQALVQKSTMPGLLLIREVFKIVLQHGAEERGTLKTALKATEHKSFANFPISKLGQLIGVIIADQAYDNCYMHITDDLSDV